MEGFDKPSFDIRGMGQSKQVPAKSKSNPSAPFLISLVPFGSPVWKYKKGYDVSRNEMLVEAGLSAVPFGAGKLGKVFRGVRSLRGADEASKIAQAAKTVPKEGRLTRLGGNLRKGVAKPVVRPGPRMTSEQADIMDVLKRYNIKGAPERQLDQLDSLSKQLSFEVDSKLSKSLALAPAKKLSADFQKVVSKNLPVDNAHKAELVRSLKELNGLAKDGNLTPHAIFKFKQGLQSRLGPAFDKMEKGADLIPKERVDMALWKQADSIIAKLEPGVKQLTRDHSKLFPAAKGLAKQAEKTAGIPILGLKSRTLERGMQAGRDVAGRGLQKLGSVSGSRLGKVLLPQAGVRAPFALSDAMAGPSVLGDQGQPLSDDDILRSALGEESLDDGEGQAFEYNPSTRELEPVMSQGQDGMLTEEQIMQMAIEDWNKTGGKNLSKIQSLRKMFAPAEEGYNSAAAGTVTDLENGLVNLRQLGKDIQSSGANSPFMGRIRGLNPYDTEAQSLQANIARVKQVIGKALEGGVLRKEDEIKYAKILPTLKDSDAVAGRKIEYLTDDLTRKLALFKQNMGRGGGGIDINSIVQSALNSR